MHTPTSLGEEEDQRNRFREISGNKRRVRNSSAANQYLEYRKWGALSATHCEMYANEARELLMRGSVGNGSEILASPYSN